MQTHAVDTKTIVVEFPGGSREPEELAITRDVTPIDVFRSLRLPSDKFVLAPEGALPIPKNAKLYSVVPDGAVLIVGAAADAGR